MQALKNPMPMLRLGSAEPPPRAVRQSLLSFTSLIQRIACPFAFQPFEQPRELVQSGFAGSGLTPTKDAPTPNAPITKKINKQ